MPGPALRPLAILLTVLGLLVSVSAAQHGPRFNYTPPGGADPSHQYGFDSGTHVPGGSGGVTETDLSTGAEIGYDWERDGDDIVVKDATGAVVRRFLKGATQGSGSTADGGTWENIDFQAPVPPADGDPPSDSD